MMDLAHLRAAMPILALGLWVFFWGHFPGAASAAGATATQLTMVAILAAIGVVRPRLGRFETASLVLLWMATLLALVLSPLPRAGRVAGALLPAFCILPWLSAALFKTEATLRAATRGLTVLLGLVAARSLVGVFFEGTPGASLPLGHHNLLAVFLLMLLPAPWALYRGVLYQATLPRSMDRYLALLAGGLALAALLLTRSLGGALAFLVFLVLLLPWERGRARIGSLVGVLLVGLVLGVGLSPRILDFEAQLGLSMAARQGYIEAGWRGFLASPFFGHGPGSTPWLFAAYFEPATGVHPPNHLVGDLHNLPLQVLFELGLLGFLTAACWLWAVQRPLWRNAAGDAAVSALGLAWVRGARAGLMAALLFSWTGFPLGVPVLPFTFCLLAGLGLAAERQLRPASEEEERRPTWRLPRVAHWLLLIVVLALILPGLRAQWAWDAARQVSPGDDARAADLLARAVTLDPDFPLYSFRLGLLRGDTELLLAASRAAGAVGPMTLQAGLAAEAAGLPEAAALLERACDLDPFGGLAPFRLAVGPAGGDPALRVQRAKRALVAEPRLVAAHAWLDHPEVLLRAQVELDRQGLPPGFAATLLPSMQELFSPEPATEADFVLRLDQDPAESCSLFLFRRSPYPAELSRIRVRVPAFSGDLPAAVLDPALRPDFAAPGCLWRGP